MKRILMVAVCVAMVLSATAQQKKGRELKFIDALELTMVGKLCETTNPYHRMETDKIEGITKNEAHLLKMTSGLAIAFRTNASAIYVKARYGTNTIWAQYAPLTATQGFNLYIKDAEGEWTWAASRAHKIIPHPSRFERMADPLHIISGLYKGEKECLLYLPLFSELEGLEIGVNPGAEIGKIENPFRHNIAVFGSSFTQGVAASCAGQTWPAFLSRSTGLHICSFGMSGNSKLQSYLGEEFGKIKADALICDAFSNPSIEEIDMRLRPFIEAVRKGNPTMPIIFINTIYRESRNFSPGYNNREQRRIDFVEQILAKVTSEYKNVYFVNVPDQTGTDHVTSADGTHPYSYGYHRWAQAIEKPILKILKKHKIK